MLDSLLNDPSYSRIIIYVLAGLCAVLAIAVIVLGVKKNSYYVDEDGNEVPPPSKKKKSKGKSRTVEEETPAVAAPQAVNTIVEEKAVPHPEHEETKVVPVQRPDHLTVDVIVSINDEQIEHPITQLPCLIGREAGKCNLVLSEPAVSRRHARFFEQDGRLYVEDVSEHNGTYVNGTKLPSLGMAELHEQDVVSLGRAEITIYSIN